jgi:hypothetical protein
MAITAAEFALFLEPKLSNIWYDAYPRFESSIGQVLNVRDMAKNTLTDAKYAGFGSLQNQADGASITYDDPISPISKAYTYIVRGLGYRIHDRIWRNDLYGEVEKLEGGLKDAAIDDVETAAFGIFNNAFGTTNVGFDGLQLCSTAHTRLDGGSTWGNRPSTDEALSLSALKNGITNLRNTVNDRGRPRVVTPKKLIIPIELEFTAKELLRSQQIPGSANNDDNVIREYSLGLVESPYLTSTTAWFLQADKHDLNFFWRFKPEMGSEEDFDTNTMKRKIRQGYTYGFGEARGIYGTDGVA